MVKIKGMSLFWKKSKLSIVGRINIAKTYLLSQIGFLAPVIPFSETQLQTLRNEIGSFVRGSLKTTINTVYNIGMIEIESYINAIRVGFFRKSICEKLFSKFFYFYEKFAFDVSSMLMIRSV